MQPMGRQRTAIATGDNHPTHRPCFRQCRTDSTQQVIGLRHQAQRAIIQMRLRNILLKVIQHQQQWPIQFLNRLKKILQAPLE